MTSHTIAWIGVAATAAHLSFIALVLVRVLSLRRPPGSTAGWLLLVVTIPYAGALLYLLIGEHRLGRRRGLRARALKPATETWLQQLAARFGQARSGPLQRWGAIRALADRAVGIAALPGNRLELLADSETILHAMATDIERAKHFCVLEFYIWNPGGAADAVGEALIQAAERGVACRVLLDAVGSKPFFQSAWPQRLVRAGVQLNRALPASMLRAMFRRVDLRLHRKLLVVDGLVGYTGSLNLVDPRYFKRDAGVGQWVDAMCRVQGPVVDAMTGLFAWDWSLETDGTPHPLTGRTKRALEPAAGPAAVQLVPSGPGYEGNGVVELLLAAVYGATKELVLTTPYFIPDEPLAVALRSAALRGVRVCLIVPAKVDSLMVQQASQAFFEDLLRAGVEVWRFHGGLLHTKSVVVDRELVFFGTLNLDIRSFRLNFELTLLVYDPEFGSRVAALADAYRQSAVRLDPARWSQRPWPQRITGNFFQLLSPLL